MPGKPRRQRTVDFPSQLATRQTTRVFKRAKAQDPAPVSQVQEDPLLLCLAVARSIGSKADKNKVRARALTVSTTATTAAIPVLIGLSGDSFILGKVLPSILAALTATVVALGQIERPHERWSLYRRYQRLLEADAKRYTYRIAPFADDQRERTLGARVAQYELDLQAEWEGLIPTGAELAVITKSGATP